RMVIVLVVVACTEGVQANSPVLGSMLAPLGAPGSRVKAKVWTGRSVSCATTVKLNVWSDGIIWLGMKSSAGGVLLYGGGLERRGDGATIFVMELPPSGYRPWL